MRCSFFKFFFQIWIIWLLQIFEHLKGIKTIIQLLSLLNKSIFLNRYFDDKKKIEQVRGIFTGLSSVDNDEQGNKAVAEAMANPEKYVLKPQREGHSIIY